MSSQVNIQLAVEAKAAKAALVAAETKRVRSLTPEEKAEMAKEQKKYRKASVRTHFAGHGVPKGSTYVQEHSWYKKGDLR